MSYKPLKVHGQNKYILDHKDHILEHIHIVRTCSLIVLLILILLTALDFKQRNICLSLMSNNLTAEIRKRQSISYSHGSDTPKLDLILKNTTHLENHYINLVQIF